jgi:prepilin-type N-terminal cleavage/methylation domain-containing protein/prepilin-type processing-associated H-X9-DG protein
MGKQQKGFTLVELLVVIAIIALLMSILMPALARVRNQAKNVLCQSNLKQLCLAFSMYAGDWDGRFLQGWHEGQSGVSHTDYWMQGLRTYYGNSHEVRLCAMATKPGTELGGGMYGGVPPDSTFVAWGVFAGDECGEPSPAWGAVTACDYGSFGNNSYVCNPPPDAGAAIQGHPVSNNWRGTNIKGAGSVPLIGDEQWIDCWPHHTDDAPLFSGMQWGVDHSISMYRICLDRHNGYVNWAFVDCGVRPVGLKELWRLKWHRTFEIDYPAPVWPDWMKKYKDYDFGR